MCVRMLCYVNLQRNGDSLNVTAVRNIRAAEAALCIAVNVNGCNF